MNEAYQNGFYKIAEEIKHDVKMLHNELAPAISRLSQSVDHLAVIVDSRSVKLETKFDAWLRVAETLIPVGFVSKIFGWVFTIIMGIFFGVEVVRWLFNAYLPAIN